MLVTGRWASDGQQSPRHALQRSGAGHDDARLPHAVQRAPEQRALEPGAGHLELGPAPARGLAQGEQREVHGRGSGRCLADHPVAYAPATRHERVQDAVELGQLDEDRVVLGECLEERRDVEGRGSLS